LLLLIIVLLANANTPWPMVLFIAALSFQLGVLSHRAWRKSVQPGINLQVDEESISRVDVQGHVTRVLWNEVARVRYVTSGGSALEFIRANEDAPSIRVPLSLENVDEFLAFVRRRTPQIVGQIPLSMKPSQGRLWYGMRLLISTSLPFPVVAAYWMMIGEWRTALWALLIPGSLLSLLFVLLALLPIREMRVEYQSVLVRSAMRESRWSFDEIDDVTLQVDRAGSLRSLEFQLRLGSGEIRKVPCLGEDPIGCFNALERMVNQSRSLLA
jgi:hypothetical protein